MKTWSVWITAKTHLHRPHGQHHLQRQHPICRKLCRFQKTCLPLGNSKSKQRRLASRTYVANGFFGPNGRKTYFAGAFPSACGKTSTAMLPGETILGDDIAYIRDIDSAARAVNVESGIFGIIQDVKPKTTL